MRVAFGAADDAALRFLQAVVFRRPQSPVLHLAGDGRKAGDSGGRRSYAVHFPYTARVPILSAATRD